MVDARSATMSPMNRPTILGWLTLRGPADASTMARRWSHSAERLPELMQIIGRLRRCWRDSSIAASMISKPIVATSPAEDGLQKESLLPRMDHAVAGQIDETRLMRSMRERGRAAQRDAVRSPTIRPLRKRVIPGRNAPAERRNRLHWRKSSRIASTGPSSGGLEPGRRLSESTHRRQSARPITAQCRFCAEQWLVLGVRIDERHGYRRSGRECIAASTTSTAAVMRG
jgi:hypothetical protein